jgi:hypothetical protein
MRTIHSNKPARYKRNPDHWETNNDPSETVVGQSYTIKDLLKNHSNGIEMEQPPQGEQNDATHDSIDYRRVHDLDPTEKEELRQTILEEIFENNKNLKLLKQQTMELKAKKASETKNEQQPDSTKDSTAGESEAKAGDATE